MADGWLSLPIKCSDGLILNTDALTQGSMLPGSAKVLQNFECALEGGYRRISGYSKFDSTTVPGDASSPVLGVKAALGGVFAARRVAATPTTDIYFSSGSGWGSRINSADRVGNPSKVRFITYSITKPVIVGCDGVNPAFKYDGTTYTLLNGAGAPVNPKYAEMFLARLVLGGHSSATSIIISSPNDDTNYAAASGALEINVGDTVTGIKNFRNTLYVFGQNRVYKLIGSSAADFALEPVTNQIGCINGDTIQEVGGDLIYLAPDGFRSVAGTYNIGDVDLSLQSRAIQPLVRAALADISGNIYSSMVIRRKSQYRVWTYNSGVPKTAAQGFIGKLEQGYSEAYNNTNTKYAWSISVGIQPYCADSYFDSNLERCVIGDPANGYVYLLESGNDFDGTAIQAVYQSPYLTFQDATLRKVLQKNTVYASFEGNASINLGVYLDFQETNVLQPATLPFSMNGSFPVYGTGVYDTSVYGALSFPVFKLNLVGSGFTASFSYSSNGGSPYRIDSYQLQYALKGRR